MTVVVAVVGKGESYMASDGMDHDGTIKVRATKMYRVSDSLVVGVAGMSKLLDVVETLADKRIGTSRLEIQGFASSCFGYLRDDLLITKDDDIEAELLFLTKDRIYSMCIDGCLYEHDRYWSIGSGSKVALGSLHRSFQAEGDLKEFASTAVEAASLFDPNCGLGIYEETVK